MKRLKQLLAEVEAVVIGPDDEPKDVKNSDDVVIGILPDGLKKLGALIARKYDQIRQMAKDGANLPDVKKDLESAELVQEYRELYAKIRATEAEVDLITDLFWVLVQLEFPETSGKEDMLVCIGFELVARKRSEPKLVDLRQALGAMGIDFNALVMRAPVGGTPQILVPGSKARN